MADYDVRIPDGKGGFTETVVKNVPDGLSVEEIKKRIFSLMSQPEVAQPEVAQPEEVKEETNPAMSALRGAEFGARGFVDSASETLGAVPDLVSAGLRQVPVVGKYIAPSDPDFYSKGIKEGVRDVGRIISSPLNQMIDFGSNQPQTTFEKGIYGVGRGAADAASIFLPAGAVSKVAKGTTKGIADVLKSQPVLQTVAGSTGGAVGEATDNPYLGTAAALSVPLAQSAPKIAKAIRTRKAAEKDFVKTAPTSEDLTSQARKAYKQAEESGIKVSASSYNRLLGKVNKTIQDEDILEADLAAGSIYEDVAKGLRAIKNREGKDLSLKNLESVRRLVNKVIEKGDSDDRRILYKIRNDLDDFVENLNVKDLSEGVSANASKVLKEARGLYSRSRKTLELEDMFERASRQASGPENGLRIEFRKLLNSDRSRRGYTPDELKAMQDVVEGKPFTNFLRKMGKFGFDFKLNSNSLMSLLGIGSGATFGGIPGAVMVPILGTAAKFGARKLTKDAGTKAKAMVAQGATLPPRQRVPIGVNPVAAPILLGRTRD